MDVLRENIGLLQLPYEDEDLNEGFLGFGKKKSRWQRFKDAIGRNKGKIAAAAGLGAGALGGDYLLYRHARNKVRDLAKKDPDTTYNDKTNQIVQSDGTTISMRYRPFGLGDEMALRDKNNNILDTKAISRKQMIKDLFTS